MMLTSVVMTLAVSWLLSGAAASIIAAKHGIPEQLPVVRGALQGWLWLRRCLLWVAVITADDDTQAVVTGIADGPQRHAPLPASHARSEQTAPQPLPVAVDAPQPQHVTPVVVVGSDDEPEMIELDPRRELEPFDKLPERPPRVGTVKTVCPRCHQRTRHDRAGTCKSCGEPNEWLLARWEQLVTGVQVRAHGPVTYDQPQTDVKSAHVVIRAPGRHCSGCQRRLRLDLSGNCMFCLTPNGDAR